MLVVRGTDLRSLRLSRGWSQKDLADRAGIRQGTVSSLENGHNARPSTVRLIAEALGVTVREVADV